MIIHWVVKQKKKNSYNRTRPVTWGGVPGDSFQGSGCWFEALLVVACSLHRAPYHHLPLPPFNTQSIHIENQPNLIKLRSSVRSRRSLLKDLTKPHIKLKSGDLSIKHVHNVMSRCKLRSDWLNTHVTEQGFC